MSNMVRAHKKSQIQYDTLLCTENYQNIHGSYAHLSTYGNLQELSLYLRNLVQMLKTKLRNFNISSSQNVVVTRYKYINFHFHNSSSHHDCEELIIM